MGENHILAQSISRQAAKAQSRQECLSTAFFLLPRYRPAAASVSATDDELTGVVGSWDRNGGTRLGCRSARTVKKTPSSRLQPVLQRL
jgi:hypothetical protein